MIDHTWKKAQRLQPLGFGTGREQGASGCSLSMERVDAGLSVLLAWLQNRGGELGPIDGVRVVLGLQTHRAAVGVLLGSLPLGRLQEVAAVELHTGLGRVDRHHATRSGVFHLGDLAEFAGLAIEHVVVVVAEERRAVELGDSVADAGRLTEVDRGAFDRSNLTRRDQTFVGQRVAVGVDLQLVVEDGLAAFTAQVEVAVIGEIHGCRLVGRGDIVDADFVLVSQLIGHGDIELAGVTFFAIRAGVPEDHAGALFVLERFGGPDDLAEVPGGAPVQVVRPVVDRQLVVFALEGELPLGDSVGDAAGGTAEVLVPFALVSGDVVEAEDHICELALLVGNLQLGESGSARDQAGDHPGLVAKRVPFDRLARAGLAEGFLFRRCGISCSSHQSQNQQRQTDGAHENPSTETVETEPVLSGEEGTFLKRESLAEPPWGLKW